MSKKTLLLIILLLILLLSVIWNVVQLKKAKQPDKKAENIPNTITHTQVIYKQVPAVVETLLVNDVPREYATLEAEKDTNDVHLSLKVGYDELDNKFDVKTDIYSTKQKIKPKTVQLTSSLGIGFGSQGLDPDYAVADMGVKIKNYRITAFADTKKTYGIRLGVDF